MRWFVAYVSGTPLPQAARGHLTAILNAVAVPQTIADGQKMEDMAIATLPRPGAEREEDDDLINACLGNPAWIRGTSTAFLRASRAWIRRKSELPNNKVVQPPPAVAKGLSELSRNRAQYVAMKTAEGLYAMRFGSVVRTVRPEVWRALLIANLFAIDLNKEDAQTIVDVVAAYEKDPDSEVPAVWNTRCTEWLRMARTHLSGRQA